MHSRRTKLESYRRMEFHRPLPNRQSIGNGRMVLRKFSSEEAESELAEEQQTSRRWKDALREMTRIS